MLLALFLSQAVVAFATVAMGTTSYIDSSRQVVVRSANDWTTLWNSHNPQQPAPAVDFGQHVVVGVFLGSRPTAGFGVTITAVKTKSGRAVVEYAERRPGPGSLVAQVITSPFHLVSIPSDLRLIEFRKVGP